MEKKFYLNSKLGILLIFLSVFFASSCSSSSASDSSSESTESTKESESFEVGDFGYLTDNCIGVVDDDDMGKVLDFVKANDMSGVQQLVAAGKATTFAAGKQIKVVKIGFELIQVRDVDASEMLVWIPKNMLTHEDVYGIYNK